MKMERRKVMNKRRKEVKEEKEEETYRVAGARRILNHIKLRINKKNVFWLQVSVHQRQTM